MFYINQHNNYKKQYKEYLYAIASFSNLFSTNFAPYIDSRIAENIFCKAFGAENLSRSDCSIDAKYHEVGIGIKTFLHTSDSTLQKIAEFNRDQPIYSDLPTKEKIIKISILRNKRLEVTARTYNTTDMIYHCITREKNLINLYEKRMDLIDIDHIKIIKESNTSIIFEDGLNEYSFNISKSVLMMRFSKMTLCDQIQVRPMDNAIETLHTLIYPKNALSDSLLINESTVQSSNISKLQEYEYVVLPLYGYLNGERTVMEKSGLNQWNASGRSRHHDEVYIPIPSKIHQVFPDFFPPRNSKFNLKLPNGKVISSKVCQENSKALMSNPNKDLGHWILRDILMQQNNTLVTYETLSELDIDSVIIRKINSQEYTLDFMQKNSFEEFKEEFMT